MNATVVITRLLVLCLLGALSAGCRNTCDDAVDKYEQCDSGELLYETCDEMSECVAACIVRAECDEINDPVADGPYVNCLVYCGRIPRPKTCEAPLVSCQPELVDPPCIDLTSDDHNCGECDNVCRKGHCQNGLCDCDNPLETYCDDGTTVSCANLSTSKANCGACGSVCSGQCVDGICTH